MKTFVFIALLIAIGCTPLCAQTDGQKPANDTTKATAPNDTVREVTITVSDQYSPSTVVVQKGKPVRLIFDYHKASCAGTVVLDGYDIRKKLTLGKKTAVEFTPVKSGTTSFHCPMHMYMGNIVVKDTLTQSALPAAIPEDHAH